MTLEINVGVTSSVTPVINYTPDPIDEYMVVVNNPEDWSVVHNYIINENEIDGIPNRKVECSNEQPFSLRTSIYKMSASEANVLKTHSKVEDVELNPEKYPQPQSLDVARYKKDVAFNKPFITAAMGSESIVYNNGIRSNWSMLFASEPSGKPYRGVGITSTDTVNRDLSFSLTGKGVDAVTIDSGVAVLHPEFLDDNGKTRVKDVILDGPYKVDPDYFVGLGVTYNKVIDGVDIGVGIATTSAEEWWENSSKRSAKFSTIGTVFISSSYTLGQAFSKTSTGESNPITGGHGTACASQIGGKSFGLGFESNLWNIRISLTDNGGVISGSTALNACTIWHKAKKINSNDPDPTILNNSWGSGSECGDSNGTSYTYWYRGSSSTYTGNNSDTNAQANIPCCVNKRFRYKLTGSPSSVGYGGKGEYTPSGSSTSSAAENAIAAGVIVLSSAGNKNQKLADKDDVDFNNAYSSSTNYINRVGGVQQGFSGDHLKGKGCIRVGALDCSVEPSDELQGATKYTPRKVCYSSNGPMIDIWSPGDKTMSAGYASYESYQRQDNSNFYDYWFGGTSAACPNAVSLVTLYLQSNRSANQDCVRHWLINHASKKGVVSDPYPDINDSAYWATNTVDSPTVDYECYNIRGCGNLRGAPNRALFNPYANNIKSSFTKNESIKSLHDRISQSSPPTSWSSAKATWMNNWYGIAFGNGKFVAIAYGESGDEGNRIMYSDDAINWSRTPAPNAAYWMGITYGNDKFVAVAQGGGTGNRVMYSYDGVYWKSASASSTSWWRNVTYGNGKFVAVSYQNETSNTVTNNVMYSSDGINWTGATASMEKNWTSVAYGDGRYVAASVGTYSVKDFMYSSDGISWTSATTSGSYNNWTSIAYGNGKFVAVSASGSGGRVAYSTDGGVNWTRSTSISEQGWWDITYGNGYFVALAKSGTGNRISYSTDGITWTGVSEPEDNDWSGIAYGNGLFVAVSDDGNTGSEIHRVMYSQLDGFTRKPLTLELGDSKKPPTSWTAATPSFSFRGITYGNGKFVAISGTGTVNISYSTDGSSWTSTSGPENNNWQDITYGGGKFVAVSADGTNRVSYSTDGSSWTSASAAEENGWADITYGNGKFVATAPNGTNRVMYSSDGINWTAASAAEQNQWVDIIYADGKFVAISQTGTNRVMYSTNGINWTSASAAEQDSWQDIAYGNGKFVAVANSGTNRVMYSTNGINWTSASAAVQNNWYDITYGSGYFVATSWNGTDRAMYSTDGINWTSASLTEEEQWMDITYGNGKFVAGAAGGTNRVMYSTVDGFTTKPVRINS